MARNYNKVILIGTIESDLELRQTAKNGTNVTNFSLITTESRDSKDGLKIYKKWHHIVANNELLFPITNHTTLLIFQLSRAQHYKLNMPKHQVHNDRTKLFLYHLVLFYVLQAVMP